MIPYRTERPCFRTWARKKLQSKGCREKKRKKRERICLKTNGNAYNTAYLLSVRSVLLSCFRLSYNFFFHHTARANSYFPPQCFVPDMDNFADRVCKLGLIIGIIIGRWLLPRGEITRDQLSALLLGYVGTAADILELFEVFDDPSLQNQWSIVLAVLIVYSFSLLQFCLVTTATTGKEQIKIASNKVLTYWPESSRARMDWTEFVFTLPQDNAREKPRPGQLATPIRNACFSHEFADMIHFWIAFKNFQRVAALQISQKIVRNGVLHWNDFLRNIVSLQVGVASWPV